MWQTALKRDLLTHTDSSGHKWASPGDVNNVLASRPDSQPHTEMRMQMRMQLRRACSTAVEGPFLSHSMATRTIVQRHYNRDSLLCTSAVIPRSPGPLPPCSLLWLKAAVQDPFTNRCMKHHPRPPLSHGRRHAPGTTRTCWRALCDPFTPVSVCCNVSTPSAPLPTPTPCQHAAELAPGPARSPVRLLYGHPRHQAR